MNPFLEAISPSLIREIDSRKKPGDVDLGLGEPLLRPDSAILTEAIEWVGRNGCRYGPNAGLPELREAVAGYYAYPGLDSAASVCITNGSQEAIFLAIKAMCNPASDEVLVVEPGYPLYRKIAQMEGVAARGVGMPAATGFAFDADRISAAVGPATRLVVICSPSNPSGRIAEQATVDRLAESLLRLPDPPWLLVDEPYREIWFESPPPPIAARYPRTLIAGSLSKSNALTGMRLGWLMAPPEVVPPIVKVHQFVLTSANIIGQRVALAIFARNLLGAHREHYCAQRTAFLQALIANNIPHVAPDGSFYAMIGLPTGINSRDAAIALVEEHGVVAIPGVAFGESSGGWLRASFVAPPDQLAEGAKRLAAYMATT